MGWREASKMAFAPKKDGGPNLKFYESAETLQLFEVVKTWLIKNCKKYVQTDPPTGKGLAAIVIQLIQFQEDAFGKNVTKPALTRLPTKCFLASVVDPRVAAAAAKAAMEEFAKIKDE